MSIVQKFKSFWFGPADNYEREDFEDLFETSDDVYATNGQLALDPVAHAQEPVKPARVHQMLPGTGTGAKILDHPNAQAVSEVLVIEPRQFEESLDIVEHLRGRKSVLLNLHMLDNEGSQRVVDFLSGACWAIDGHQQRIGDGVFLFAPASVTISSESTSSKAIKEAFWNKAQPM
ncbi:cell division protein SepF [soil metagenome]